MSAASDESEFVDAVADAADALRSLFAETPLQENDYLSEKTGARVFLKREDLTPVRSYKIRGAFNFFRKAMAKGGNGHTFVCASAGNHAQGFAYVCRHFGCKGVVFMPVTTPHSMGISRKREKTTPTPRICPAI